MLNKLKARLNIYVANVKARAAESEIEYKEAMDEHARYRYGSEQLNELIKRSKYPLGSNPHYIDNNFEMKKQFKDAIDIVNSCPNEQKRASKSDRDIRHIHPSIKRLF